MKMLSSPAFFGDTVARVLLCRHPRRRNELWRGRRLPEQESGVRIIDCVVRLCFPVVARVSRALSLQPARLPLQSIDDQGAATQI